MKRAAFYIQNEPKSQTKEVSHMEPYKRLYRSKTNRVLAGVCGGIGEYFNIDPVIIRVLAIVVLGFGWLVYLICALIMPSQP